MSLAIVLNSSNVSNVSNNTQFTYNFLQGALVIPDDSTITITDITMPYSFFNITLQYQNQVFQIKWPDVAATVYTITIPAGFYTVSDINNYLVSYCITNNLYLLDANGNYITYISLSYNSTYYAVQLNCYLVPISLPAGYSNPGSMAYSNGSPKTPQFYIPSGNFGKIIGLSPLTYYPSSPSASNFSQLSTSTPVGSNINCIIVRCNLVDNNAIMPSDILGSFPINTTFGGSINYAPTFEIKLNLKPGRYSNMVITFVDQNFNTIYANDNNCLITLLLNLNNNKVIKSNT